MIIYQNTVDIEIIAENLFKLSENEEAMHILISYYSVMFMDSNNPEIKILLKDLNMSMIPPLTLFLYDNNHQYTKNQNLVLNSIEGFIESSYLAEMIVSSLNKKDNLFPGNNSQPIIPSDNDVPDFLKSDSHLSPVELLEKQKRELEQMEKEAHMIEIEKMKKEEERKKILMKEEAMKKKISSERRTKEFIRKNLLPEPSKSDKQACTIVFRMPDGSTKERLFLKNWTVIEMYNYINSLEHVLTEEETEFDLFTPFPPKVYENYDKTLEEEGLYPNAVLIVREK